MVVTDDDARGREGAAAALPRDDHADLGSTSRSRLELRRRGAGLQLPDGRDARRARARAARDTSSEQNAQRARIVASYREALDGVNGLAMPFPGDADVMPAHHLAVLILPERCSRDDFRTSLAERRVQTSVHYPPIHTFSAYDLTRFATSSAGHRGARTSTRHTSPLPAHVRRRTSRSSPTRCSLRRDGDDFIRVAPDAERKTRARARTAPARRPGASRPSPPGRAASLFSAPSHSTRTGTRRPSSRPYGGS